MQKSAIESRSTVKTQIKGGVGFTPQAKRQALSAGGAGGAAKAATQAVTIPKPVFKFSTTPKTVSAKPKQEIKMELDEDISPMAKRKRDEDDFEIVG